jgi:hypothetical protein
MHSEGYNGTVDFFLCFHRSVAQITRKNARMLVAMS